MSAFEVGMMLLALPSGHETIRDPGAERYSQSLLECLFLGSHRSFGR